MRFELTVLAATLACATRAEAACNWPRGEILEISGDVAEGDLRGTFTRSLAPGTGRFAEAIDLGPIKTGTGFDGHLAWSRDVSGASHYLTSDFAKKLAVSESWLARNLDCPVPTHSAEARHRGASETGFDVWKLTPAGGAPIELWYNFRTGQLDRAVLQYSENRLIHHFSDWREVAPGRLIPFVQRDEDPEDESETVYTVRSVAEQKAASFDPPPLPSDSTILSGESTTIPFQDDGGRRIYLPVYLDGKGPFAFELDNGGHFILTEATAKELGLSAQGSFSSTGAGNAIRQGGYVPIAKLRVGDSEVLNQTAKVLPLSNNDRGSLPPRAGILGLEFFERFIVAIDHRAKTVTLRLISAPVRTPPGRPLRLVFDEDAPLVEGSFEGSNGNFMLDIGNAGPTIIEDYWASEHGLAAALSKGTPDGSSKLSKGTIGIGPFRLTDEKVRYFGSAERGSEYTRSVAAIAGEPLLSRFNAVYDYRQETVWFDPLARRPAVSVEKRP
jgi:hypothetical protein